MVQSGRPDRRIPNRLHAEEERNQGLQAHIHQAAVGGTSLLPCFVSTMMLQAQLGIMLCLFVMMLMSFLWLLGQGPIIIKDAELRR